MSILTRMALTSALAVGAALFAGCGDTDCPSEIPINGSCSSAGLMCSASQLSCTCDGTTWQCVAYDLMVPELHDLSPPKDLTPAGD